jgi:hypothetical protein
MTDYEGFDKVKAFIDAQLKERGFTIDHWHLGEFFIGGEYCIFKKEGRHYYLVMSILTEDKILFGIDGETKGDRLHLDITKDWKVEVIQYMDITLKN